MSSPAKPTPLSRLRVFAALCALASAGWVLGCQQGPTPTAPAEQPLSVFAAASLRDVFTQLEQSFVREHASARVNFSFAGSQELRVQLEQGANADVFASADQLHMQELVAQSRVGVPTVFARNELVLVVAAELASKVRSLEELPQASRIVLGAEQVPIGRYSSQLLQRATRYYGADFKARVEAKVASRELNVKQVLAKLTLGEADAGIVYRSDVHDLKEPFQGQLRLIALGADVNVSAEYPVAVVSGSAQRQLAEQWVRLLLSEPGQAALQAAGFSPRSSEAPP